MADQDFNIDINTRAHLAGIEQTKSALTDLQRRAAATTPGQALAERDAARAAAGAAGAAGEGGGIAALGTHIERSFARYALHAVGIGLLLQLDEAIKKTAEELNKITDELDKQGETLIKNAQLFHEQAIAATTEADALRVGTSAVKELEAAHKRLDAIQKEELSTTQQAMDAYTLLSQGRLHGEGPLAKALREAKEQAAKELETARKEAISATRQSEFYKDEFNRRAYGEPRQQAIDELTAKIKQLGDEQKRVGINNIEEYLRLGREQQIYIGHQEEIIRLQKQEQQELDKMVLKQDAQTQSIIANEQAAAKARAEGRGKDAEMFEKSAAALRAGALPQQKAMADWIKAQQTQITGAAGAAPAAAPGVSASYQNRLKNVPPGYDLNLSTGELVPKGAQSLTGEAARKARELEEHQRKIGDFLGTTGAGAEDRRKADIEATKEKQLREKIEAEGPHGKGVDGKVDNKDVVAAIDRLRQVWS